MKPWISVVLLVMGLLAADAARGAIVYENATEDTFQTSVFSSIAATEIGDRIRLGGTARFAQRASVQFYNVGSPGSFAATLTFYEAGAPVGAAVGSFLVNGITMDQDQILTVDFDNLNLSLPTDLIFTIALSNVTNGTDPGLNFFGLTGPTVGSSDTNLYVINDGNFLEVAPVVTDAGNLFFVLDAIEVPGPSGAMAFLLVAIAVLPLRRKH